MSAFIIIVLLFFVVAFDVIMKNVRLSYAKPYNKSIYDASDNKDEWWYFIPYIVAFLLFSLRDVSVGTDTLNYYNKFKNNDFSGIELLYRLINQFVLLFNGNFVFVQIIIGAILINVYYFAFKELSINKHLSFALFVGLGYFAQTMNITRQYLAFGFILLALAYLIKKKYIFALIFYICAFLFHKTSIICGVFALFYLIPLNWKSLIAYIGGGALIIGLFPYIIKAFDKIFKTYYFNVYIEKNIGFSVTSFISILIALVFLAFLIYFNNKNKEKLKIEGKDKLFNFYILSMYAHILISIIAMIYSPTLNRITTYFYLSSLFMVPLILKYLNKKISYVVIIALVLLSIFNNIFVIGIQGGYGVNPYRLCF